jgi:hypothetical protein
MARYKYVVEGNKVTCISKFAGNPVKGYAKCSPNDKFDYEIGKELARARCDAKVAKKRLKRSKEKMGIADRMVHDMTTYYFDMVDYNTDSINEYEDCLARLRVIESKL